MELEQGLDMGFPDLALLFRIGRKIDQVSCAHRGKRARGGTKMMCQPFADQRPLPAKELAPLGGTPLAGVIGIIKQVSQESPNPKRRPLGARVAGIRRRAIEQRQEGDLLALFAELAGHLKGHISPKTIAAEK